MTDTTAAVLDRGDALRELADAIAGRHHFVVPLAPEEFQQVEQINQALPGGCCYLDAGQPTVLRLRPAPRALSAFLRLLPLPLGVVLVAPKTPEARRRLSHAGDRPIPINDQQDLVIPYYDGEGLVFPLLFVDALDLADPVAAARLRASATGWA